MFLSPPSAAMCPLCGTIRPLLNDGNLTRKPSGKDVKELILTLFKQRRILVLCERALDQKHSSKNVSRTADTQKKKSLFLLLSGHFVAPSVVTS